MEPTYAQLVNALVAANKGYQFPMTYDDATAALVNVKLTSRKKQPKPLTLKATPSKECGKSELKKYRYINKK